MFAEIIDEIYSLVLTGMDRTITIFLAWLGLAWLGLAWLGLAWLGLAWLGLAWLGLARLGGYYRIDHSGRYALYFRYLKMNTQVADDRRG